MNLLHLSAFRAVAESRHFTRGAEALAVSQPVVSKQIRQLEQALGTKLIDRSGRVFALTPEGESLLGYARRIFELVNDAERSVSTINSLKAGRLRIGATPTLGAHFLPRTLVYFRTRFPGIDLSAHVATSSELEQRLLDGRLDAVLTASAPANDGLKATLLLKHPLHVVASAQHPAAKLKSCTIAQLADYPLLGRDITTATSQPLARLFASAGRTFAPAMTFATTEAVKHAVLAGLGVALLPEMAIAPELRDGSLKVVRVKGVKLHQHVWWLERDGHGRNKAAQAYWCIVEHAAHNKLPKPRALST